MINSMLLICDENIDHIVICMRVLYDAYPDTDWMGQLRDAAGQWQPFISRGLSIDWWLDKVAEEIN